MMLVLLLFSLNVAGQDVQARIRTLGNLTPLGDCPERKRDRFSNIHTFSGVWYHLIIFLLLHLTFFESCCSDFENFQKIYFYARTKAA
jgi:hypothetical protein